MHRFVLLALVASALPLATAGCGSREAASEVDVLDILAQPRSEAEDAAMIERGHRLFWSKSCQNCHVLEGEQRNAPLLANLYDSRAVLVTGEQIERDHHYLAESILHAQAKVVAGYTQQMSNYKFALTAEEVADLIRFLDTYSPRPDESDAPPPHASSAERSP